jgi:ParB-like nuclease domain
MSITSSVATVEVAEIKPDRGNRPLASTHVRDLRTSFQHTTSATAIIVRSIPDSDKYKWEVVAGFHRLEAIRQSGQTKVHVIIVEEANEVQLELIRLHENLLHRALTPTQDAKAMARTREIYQALTPGSKRGGDRKSKTQNGSTSFADATAAATGRSKTAINRAAARGEQVASDVLNAVEGTPLDSGAFLDKLARVSPIDQRKLVADELTQTDNPTETQPDVEGDIARLRRAWAQACTEAREQFLAEVTNNKKSAGPH